MGTFLFSHPLCLEHRVAPIMPEQPARLEVVLAALETPAFSGLYRRQASLVSTEDLLLAHSRSYVEKVMSLIPDAGFWALDDETIVSPQSGEAARAAAGCVVGAVGAVLRGEAQNAFCAVRPPGHHAGPNYSGGFCLFNNVAIGALTARSSFGVKRIAIVDFDAHHGNGTQDIFWNDPDVFFASIHQQSLMPNSGTENERGAFDNVLNMPLPEGAGGESFRDAISGRLLPRLIKFKPEIIFVSAGFDTHKDDPLSGLNLVEDDYHWLSEVLLEAAGSLCNDRLVAVLEGGYNLDVLGACVAAFIKPMLTEE